MQSLETKVDCEVHNAREIPASEFEVKPEFLKEIQKLWREKFLPRSVRAEPYKIHLYGPGSHFKSHCDTPKRGLVGTFLVGLGNTSSASAGHFCIADKTLKAHACSWVVFHPDIPHEITKLEDGYHAVMAFKIFRMDENDSEDTLPVKLEARMKRILDQIPTLFGLFTTHQYSIGTTRLNRFDALLWACARSRNDTQVHMLPIVTEFSGKAFDFKHYRSDAESQVYPFTGAHVDILLEKDVIQAEEEVGWLDGLSEIPFFGIWRHLWRLGGRTTQMGRDTLAIKLIRNERILSICHMQSCSCRKLPSDHVGWSEIGCSDLYVVPSIKWEHFHCSFYDIDSCKQHLYVDVFL